jgi:fructose-specific phosphotransferase system IIC component
MSDSNTLNNVGTGSSVLLAGALTGQAERAAGTCLRVSPYSAEGRGPTSGPAFSAVADANRVLPGIRVGGSQGGMLVRMNGTSMAAPQAARWLANQMGHGLHLAALRAVLARPGPCSDARQGRKEI